MNAANMLFTNFFDEKVGGAQNTTLVGKSTRNDDANAKHGNRDV